MERICFVLRVRPGQGDEYDRRHHELWPELRAAIEQSGIHNYSLFRRDDLVIGYAECVPSFAATQLAGDNPESVGPRWHAYMSDVLFDSGAELQLIKEVWHLD